MDAPGDPGTLSRVMPVRGSRGTPTLVPIDREGRMRARHFGQIGDLALGAEIMALMREPRA